MAINFDKYAQEGNAYINNLSEKLGHPEEKGRTGILLRAVLHTLRDRITMAESLNLLAQLPAFLKVVYVDNWKYKEKPESLKDREEFLSKVEEHQNLYGEQEFSWNKSTEELTAIVLESLHEYLTEGEIKDVMAQLPEDLKAYFKENLLA
jgi:uncharacterized protein (DUF2267 family)